MCNSPSQLTTWNLVPSKEDSLALQLSCSLHSELWGSRMCWIFLPKRKENREYKWDVTISSIGGKHVEDFGLAHFIRILRCPHSTAGFQNAYEFWVLPLFYSPLFPLNHSISKCTSWNGQLDAWCEDHKIITTNQEHFPTHVPQCLLLRYLGMEWILIMILMALSSMTISNPNLASILFKK